MANHIQYAVAILLLLMLGLAGSAFSQSPVSVPGQVFSPGFDDMMTMLIQPRHVRLYYAGSAKNWELAAAQVRDLRSSFERTAKVMPNYLGNDVAASVQTMIEPQMQELDAAIAAADSAKFAAGYEHLTAACNACHTYMEHPFIVIKVPTAPSDIAQPDQDFGPGP